ncbi:MAG TPA: carboxypeptidase-like regulatory domain-containing protein [Terriglobia bacterium]|nr:carboxypeptidase-like regulatory domain-containing protein [Terriglobia bacterium]
MGVLVAVTLLTLISGSVAAQNAQRITRKKGAIEGRVVDDKGAPLRLASVGAFVRRQNSGTTTEWVALAMIGQLFASDVGVPILALSMTDDQGRYRLEDLEPGDYYVGANATTRPFDVRFAAGPEIDVPIFYPGTSDAALATAVRVPVTGGDLRGIDFAVRRVRAGSVTGIVVMPGGNSPAAVSFPVEVSLIPAGLRPTGSETAIQVVETADGKFRFNDVIPGRYRIVVTGNQQNRQLTAIDEIYVQAGPAETATLTLHADVRVSGRIHYDDPLPPDFDVSQLAVALRLADSPRLRFRSPADAKVKSDGSFELSGLTPGAHYTLSFINSVQMQSGGYVTARYGAIDALNGPIAVQPGETPIEAHIGFRRGSVEVILMERDKPQPGAAAVLVSLEHSAKRIYNIIYSDANGRATFTDLAPGDYELFALEYLPASQVIEEFDGRGRLIRVEKDRTTREVIPVFRIADTDVK